MGSLAQRHLTGSSSARPRPRETGSERHLAHYFSLPPSRTPENGPTPSRSLHLPSATSWGLSVCGGGRAVERAEQGAGSAAW